MTIATSETVDTGAALAEQAANVASERATAKKEASQKNVAPRGQKGAKSGKVQAAAPKKKAASKCRRWPDRLSTAWAPETLFWR